MRGKTAKRLKKIARETKPKRADALYQALKWAWKNGKIKR